VSTGHSTQQNPIPPRRPPTEALAEHSARERSEPPPNGRWVADKPPDGRGCGRPGLPSRPTPYGRSPASGRLASRSTEPLTQLAAGYDCSGATSYLLHAAGLLGDYAEDSTQLETFAQPGPVPATATWIGRVASSSSRGSRQAGAPETSAEQAHYLCSAAADKALRTRNGRRQGGVPAGKVLIGVGGDHHSRSTPVPSRQDASTADLMRCANAGASLMAAFAAKPTMSLPRPWPSKVLRIVTFV
jgi:hypothetical protein